MLRRFEFFGLCPPDALLVSSSSLISVFFAFFPPMSLVFPPPAGLLLPGETFGSDGLILEVFWLVLVFPGAPAALLPWTKHYFRLDYVYMDWRLNTEANLL